MKIPSPLFLTLFTLTLLPVAWTEAHDTRAYELRTYWAHEGKLDDLIARFRDHTCDLFARRGIENVGYWVPKDNPENKLIYILAFPSRLDQESMWKAFQNDSDWKSAARASIKDGRLVKKIESIWLKTTDYSMPVKKIQASPERLFELRTYITNEGKLNHLDARFRDHTIGLFEKHGIENIAYFHAMPDQEGATNTLIYLVAHESEESRGAAFKSFSQDEDWKSAKAGSEERAGGSLTIKGGVKGEFLLPTDFSSLK
ncbi:MAG: NIPSNAP family protein [Opitutaceae bacterium]|nr:NIPSNAP family protein [Opitutaceae bacterium]|tara:strand:- start:276 stop:1046 length:771 start_codon:yes stop_codon:yes gene_type:complete